MKDYVEYFDELMSGSIKLGHSIPNTMHGYNTMHEGTLKSGVLERKTKELIALGIAISSKCDGCVTHHTHDALKYGATEAEIQETIGVAILMGGGPSAVYGIKTMQALEQFKKEN